MCLKVFISSAHRARKSSLRIGPITALRVLHSANQQVQVRNTLWWFFRTCYLELIMLVTVQVQIGKAKPALSMPKAPLKSPKDGSTYLHLRHRVEPPPIPIDFQTEPSKTAVNNANSCC